VTCSLCLPKGLEPIVEVYLQGLLQGSSTDIREASAHALGDAVAATSAPALKPFIVKITGPLIRIVGDRFPPSVKAAILLALGLIISKAGVGLKPFVPQLQTTFLKCLPDPVEDVRMAAAHNLGALASLMSTRVDQLATELANSARSSDKSLKPAYLTALRGILANAAAKLTAVSLPPIGQVLRALAAQPDNDDAFLVPLAGCLGEYCAAAPEADARSMLAESAFSDPLPAGPGATPRCA
jgi:hypothetical protein